MVLICFINDLMLNIFFMPFLSLFSWSIWSNFYSFLTGFIFSLIFECWKFFIYSRYKSLSGTYSQYFFPGCVLYLHLSNSDFQKEVFNFWIFKLLISLFLYESCFHVVSEKFLPNPKSQRFSAIFFYRFYHLFTFRSVIQF